MNKNKLAWVYIALVTSPQSGTLWTGIAPGGSLSRSATALSSSALCVLSSFTCSFFVIVSCHTPRLCENKSKLSLIRSVGVGQTDWNGMSDVAPHCACLHPQKIIAKTIVVPINSVKIHVPLLHNQCCQIMFATNSAGKP